MSSERSKLSKAVVAMASTSSASTRQATTFFTAPEEASTSSICEVEERIEHSKRHWSLLAESDCSFTEEQEAADNVEVFRTLQSHPTWGFFFRTFGYNLGVQGSSGTLEVGEKFAEGGQAELFHAQVTWRHPEHNKKDRENGMEWVVKVFKKGTLLRHLHKQWPHDGYLEFTAELWEQEILGKTDLGPRFCCQVMSGTLLEDGRFAFLMTKEEGDLRRLIERKMLERGHGYEGPPFPKEKAEEIMYRVADGMNWLHSLCIVHRDLKASNVLVDELWRPEYLWCGVADFECSVGVVGTGFFRAPEVLQACKDGVTSKPGLFTEAVDVYTYGMTCYEILIGKLPFQDHPLMDNNIGLLADHVINGLHLEVPNFVDDWAVELLQRCWHSQPLARPTIGEILLLLEANSNSEFIKTRKAERG